MKKYKERIFGMGIDAVAVMPFDSEPDADLIENHVAYYLNNNLMKVEANEFVSRDRYLITYEEVQVEL